MMPVGEGDVHRIVDVLIEDARSKGVPRLLGVCSYMHCGNWKLLFQERFTFTADRDYF